MAATSLQDLDKRIAITEKEIATLQSQLADLKARRQALKIQSTNVDYDAATEAKRDDLHSMHAIRGDDKIPWVDLQAIEGLRGLYLVANKADIAIRDRIERLSKLLSDQTALIKTATTYTQGDATMKKNYDHALTKDASLIAKIKEFLDPSKKREAMSDVELSDGKLSKLWEGRLDYLRSRRNKLIFAGSRVGQYLASHQSEAYDLLFDIVKFVRRILLAHKTYLRTAENEKLQRYPAFAEARKEAEKGFAKIFSGKSY